MSDIYYATRDPIPVASADVGAEAPGLLPLTGGEAGHWLAMGLVLAGLGLMGGGWLLRRRHQP
jgi:LPXTG-motif cell wall-anchored protein